MEILVESSKNNSYLVTLLKLKSTSTFFVLTDYVCKLRFGLYTGSNNERITWGVVTSFIYLYKVRLVTNHFVFHYCHLVYGTTFQCKRDSSGFNSPSRIFLDFSFWLGFVKTFLAKVILTKSSRDGIKTYSYLTYH